jgi:hypothetical protein
MCFSGKKGNAELRSRRLCNNSQPSTSALTVCAVSQNVTGFRFRQADISISARHTFRNVDTERLPSRTEGNQRAAVLTRVVTITRNVRKSVIGICSYVLRVKKTKIAVE